MPSIDLFEENNVREGFAEPDQIERVVEHLPEYLKDATRFAYALGWRKGAVATLQWAAVDRANGTLLLRAISAKNKKPLHMQLTPMLRELVERRWQARQEGCLFVFHRNGRPLGDCRESWASACEAAGLPDLRFHDMRRSAVRNLDRAGVPERIAMTVSQHKTRSMYDRYNIVDGQDVTEALARTEVYVAERLAAAQNPPKLAGEPAQGPAGASHTVSGNSLN